MPKGLYNHYKIKGKKYRKLYELNLNTKEIINQYQVGKCIDDIIKEHHINITQLYYVLNKYNIKRNKFVYTQRQRVNPIILTKIERAYIAGLFDGEGCLHKKDKKFWSICIANTNKTVMKWLKVKLNNGGIYKKHKILNNKIHTYYTWQTSKQNAIYDFVKLIKPYCIIKLKIMNIFLQTRRVK